MLYDKAAKQLGVRVSQENYEKMTTICTKFNISYSELIRRAITEYLKKFEM